MTGSPFRFRVTEIEKAGIPVSVEDSVEIITIAKEKAFIRYNNLKAVVETGLQSTRFAASPGPVEITDRFTYSFSNQLQANFKEIFGTMPLLYSQEYNADAPGNHIHFYKKQ